MQHRKCSLHMWAFIFCNYLVLGHQETVVHVHQQGRRVEGKRRKCVLDEHVSVYFGSKMLSSTEYISRTSQHPALEGSSLCGVCRLRGQVFTFTAHWQCAVGLGSYKGRVSFLGRYTAIHHFHESTKYPQTSLNTISFVLKMWIPCVGSGVRQNSGKAWVEVSHMLSQK